MKKKQRKKDPEKWKVGSARNRAIVKQKLVVSRNFWTLFHVKCTNV